MVILLRFSITSILTYISLLNLFLEPMFFSWLGFSWGSQVEIKIESKC